MKILHRRIRFPQNYLTEIQNGEHFYIGLLEPSRFAAKLEKIGFNPTLAVGQQVLPAIIGPVTRFNANGGHRILRNLPLETRYREAEIKDWHGNYHTVYIPYKRYPRESIAAPNVELLIRNGGDDSPMVVSPILVKNNDAQNLDDIKHIINLFLEIFGECEILRENLLPIFNIPVTRLNWNILPSGNYPWQTLKSRIQGVISSANQQRQNIILRRIERISLHTPNFVAVGNAGFRGYIVFGFSGKDFFVLESIYTGNATYVLGQNWEQISRMTKEQILNQNLHQRRFVHSQGWESQIDALLS